MGIWKPEWPSAYSKECLNFQKDEFSWIWWLHELIQVIFLTVRQTWVATALSQNDKNKNKTFLVQFSILNVLIVIPYSNLKSSKTLLSALSLQKQKHACFQPSESTPPPKLIPAGFILGRVQDWESKRTKWVL